ncbi:hypothetical protein [Sphingomonas sp. BAUL-RG-20F-R05-02]|uniref:hypothetical protein n=1 Tax=Sphingomonas sp. BAUL-RG-20F-R05-02 TaxID=2914830 RepID=UPI001F57182B|nr:hypothetical protein [Sphingomonas sp. BAUL-RG-20F-R05-02]
MLLRLLLCLLLATLGCQPAAAMPCHDAGGMTMAAEHGTPAERHHEAMPAHACLGCIPPETLRAGALPAPVVAPTLPVAPAPARLDPDGGTPPALPPPRV